ncbi:MULTISPECIES: hypothetical protein [Polymorphospora]|uniref:Uncharacterized protein n=1 Tax=Polymorphospora lycopeni TaxID=3140240 RepID=A0ABV5CT62_9ACTN
MDALVLPLALLSVLCLPAVVAALICADEMIDRLTARLVARRRARRERRTVARLEQDAGPGAITSARAVAGPFRQVPIEQLAADLRRLAVQRRYLGSESLLWRSAFAQAYDDRLRMASQSLGIAQHLDELAGFDLDIERIRVEGELAAAGLMLPAATTWQRREPR